jgi:hypothetical protein
MDSKRLAEIEGRWSATTDGPWMVRNSMSNVQGSSEGFPFLTIDQDRPLGWREPICSLNEDISVPAERRRANAEFVAESWRDVDDLRLEVLRLVGVLKKIASSDGDAPWHERTADEAVKGYGP